MIRLFGEWLANAGFVKDVLATAASEPGCITLKLHDSGIERYSALVKYARENKLKLFQIAKYYKNRTPYIEIRGSCLNDAGFAAGDLYDVFCEYGLVKLRKLDLDDLGF